VSTHLPWIKHRWALWLACGALAAVLSLTDWSRGVDDRLHDALTAQLPDTPAPAGVAVVDIDERSLALMGAWPWPRPLMAEIVKSLRQRGVRVQVWDVMLPQAGAGDDVLAAALSSDDVVLGQVLITDPAVQHPPRDGRLIASPGWPSGACSQVDPVLGHIGLSESLGTRVHAGHVGATTDADGRLRRLPAVICHEGQHYPQLSLSVAQAAAPTEEWIIKQGVWPWEPSKSLIRGQWRFPLESDGWLRVPYARAHHAWPAVSIEQVLDPSVELPQLHGAVVVIGATALGMGDVVSTPFHPAAPGLSIHAELIAAALPYALEGMASSPVRSTVWLTRGWAHTGWAMLLSLVPGLWLIRRLRPHSAARGAIMLTLVVLAAPVLAALLARTQGWMWPIWPAFLALLMQAAGSWVLNTVILRRESRRLTRHLESFMPAIVARRVVAGNPTGESLGEPCTGTLMAVRVAGIERWVGSVEATQGLALIHAIHATAQALAAKGGGRLEHAQGHTLLLAWPGATAPTVRQAMEVARQCTQEFAPLLAQNESETHPLSLHMSIESGAYLLGVVGQADSRRAVLIGAAATDALAMLELNDELASPVLLGAQAARLVEAAPDVQRLGQFILPDQIQPKLLYRYASGDPQPASQAA
jgi:adenylate cyclase